MSDQLPNKEATPGILWVFFVQKSIEPEILNYQIICSVLSRTTHIPSTRREWSTATSSNNTIIAFEELNDEGSDTVFHAENTVSKSLHDHYTHRDTIDLRASDLDITKLKKHSSCCEIKLCRNSSLRAVCVTPIACIILCVVAEAGSVRACQLLRREHAANLWPSLCWPWMLGRVEMSRNALETSLRGQTRGSVCVGSDLSDRNMYELGIGFTQETKKRRKRQKK